MILQNKLTRCIEYINNENKYSRLGIHFLAHESTTSTDNISILEPKDFCYANNFI